MNASEPVRVEDNDETAAACRVTPPPAAARAVPLIFASPHSGRLYPRRMMDASRLSWADIRRSEDAFMDQLIEGAPAHGATVIAAQFARVYLDVNREPWELDASMFEDELPAYARARTPRVAAGLGAIAKVVSEGQEVYARKLSFAEAEARVEAAHRPYHAALTALIDATLASHGVALLLDWHSMPASAARHGPGGRCDFVLGDRFGAACAPAVSRLVERHLQNLGYRVARNIPYAGGYTTEQYGRPARRVHALQIEINRDLYLDEAKVSITHNFQRLRSDLESLFAALAAADWRQI